MVNLLKKWKTKRRIKKYIRKWQKDIGYIEGEIKNYDIKTGGNNGANMWGVILQSEIYSLIKENKRKTIKELEVISEERKFDSAAQKYLISMIRYLKLLKR